MIDLLPCPFCGGEARLTVHEGYHRASCFTCGNGTRAYADRHEAVRRWSRRQKSGTFQNGNDHATTSKMETVGEDAAMSELPNNCKRLREQLKKSLEREEQIERELTEVRAQVALLRGALEEIAHKDTKTMILMFGMEERVGECGHIAKKALSSTPAEAAERVNGLVEALEFYEKFEIDIMSDEGEKARKALAAWRGQEN